MCAYDLIPLPLVALIDYEGNKPVGDQSVVSMMDVKLPIVEAAQRTLDRVSRLRQLAQMTTAVAGVVVVIVVVGRIVCFAQDELYGQRVDFPRREWWIGWRMGHWD